MKTKYIALIVLSAMVMACNQAKKETKPEDHAHHNMEAGINDYAELVNSGKIDVDTMKGSPARVAMNTIGKTHIHITYNAPGVKGRVIWGGLVPYNTIWVTGAHHATKIRFSRPVKIMDKTIPVGEYALFTIPGKQKWIIILNKKADQHLTDDYHERDDLLKFDVIPTNDHLVQRLTYTVESKGENTGAITMQWEKLKISFPFVTLM